ncbi:MAG: WD40 repeat domain-containing protein [Candidatus Poribacteria bacterium]|nr:WD40 repeat domain-containing protein [Candidatus Poribacteria bacterium]
MKIYNQPLKGCTPNYPTENTICLPSNAVVRFGKGGVSDVAVSPDRHLIAVASRIGAWTYNAHTGEFVSLIGVESTGILSTVVFSPDCSRLALGDWDGRITLWDIGTKENIWCVTHEKQVSSIRFSANGRYLETLSSDGVVNILRVDDGTRVTRSIKETFSENWAAHGEKWKDKNISKALANHSRHDHGWLVAFSHHGKHLAGLNKADTLTLWEIATGEKTSTFERVTEHGEWVSIFRGRTLVCSPEGRYFVVSFFNTEHHTVTLWNEKTLKSFTSDMPILSAAASPNGRLLATGGWDKSVTLWNIETQKPFCTLEGHIGEISDLAFSQDGSLLVSGGARNWKYEEDEDGSTLRPEELYTFQSGADGTVRYFFSGNNPTDTTAKIWEIPTGRNIVTLKHPDVINRVMFSPEGTRLATSTRKTIILWCTKTWQSVATLDTVKIECLAFSPDGARLAIGGTWPEHKIQIWDVKMGELVVEFSGHKSDVESLAFSPDGRLLASGGFDGVIYLWDMTPYL